MAERDVVDRGVDELILQTFIIALTHLCKAEGIEYPCVSVDILVVVRGVCGRNEDGALRDERPVDESDVLHCLARERRYGGGGVSKQ